MKILTVRMIVIYAFPRKQKKKYIARYLYTDLNIMELQPTKADCQQLAFPKLLSDLLCVIFALINLVLVFSK